MLIGYARVSTKYQDTALQEDALRRAGVERLFVEKASGAKRDRPRLEAALDQLREGDVFVVWKVDRLARSLSHLLAVVEDLKARGVGFRSLTENFDTTTASGEAFFHICGVMAQLERRLIEERREAGIAKARADGKRFGRKPADDPTASVDKSGRLAKALLAIADGKSLSAAAKEYRLGKATLSRHLAKRGEDLRNDFSVRAKRNGHTEPIRTETAIRSGRARAVPY